jgi:hypothetical protein
MQSVWKDVLIVQRYLLELLPLLSRMRDQSQGGHFLHPQQHHLKIPEKSEDGG